VVQVMTRGMDTVCLMGTQRVSIWSSAAMDRPWTGRWTVSSTGWTLDGRSVAETSYHQSHGMDRADRQGQAHARAEYDHADILAVRFAFWDLFAPQEQVPPEPTHASDPS